MRPESGKFGKKRATVDIPRSESASQPSSCDQYATPALHEGKASTALIRIPLTFLFIPFESIPPHIALSGTPHVGRGGSGTQVLCWVVTAPDTRRVRANESYEFGSTHSRIYSNPSYRADCRHTHLRSVCHFFIRAGKEMIRFVSSVPSTSECFYNTSNELMTNQA